MTCSTITYVYLAEHLGDARLFLHPVHNTPPHRQPLSLLVSMHLLTPFRHFPAFTPPPLRAGPARLPPLASPIPP
jgi:hypothetical protein